MLRSKTTWHISKTVCEGMSPQPRDAKASIIGGVAFMKALSAFFFPMLLIGPVVSLSVILHSPGRAAAHLPPI